MDVRLIPMARWPDGALLSRIRDPYYDVAFHLEIGGTSARFEFDSQDLEGDQPNWFDRANGSMVRGNCHDDEGNTDRDLTLEAIRRFAWFCTKTVPSDVLLGPLTPNARRAGLPLRVGQAEEILAAFGPDSDFERLATQPLPSGVSQGSQKGKILREFRRTAGANGLSFFQGDLIFWAQGVGYSFGSRTMGPSEFLTRSPTGSMWVVVGPDPWDTQGLASIRPSPWAALEGAGLVWPGGEEKWEEENLVPGELLVEVDVYQLLGTWPPCWSRWSTLLEES